LTVNLATESPGPRNASHAGGLMDPGFEINLSESERIQVKALRRTPTNQKSNKN